MLRALGWEHPRCLLPMRHAADIWRAREGVEVVWETRSLTAFGDGPLEELAGYDLAVIDHPTCGAAAAAGLLRPFEQLPDTAVGQSHASYRYDGRQWALPVDAACQVQALGLDGPAPPATWDEARALVRRLGPRAALPLAPAHALSS